MLTGHLPVLLPSFKGVGHKGIFTSRKTVSNTSWRNLRAIWASVVSASARFSIPLQYFYRRIKTLIRFARGVLYAALMQDAI